jgi:hypothetical protein
MKYKQPLPILTWFALIVADIDSIRSSQKGDRRNFQIAGSLVMGEDLYFKDPIAGTELS